MKTASIGSSGSSGGQTVKIKKPTNKTVSTGQATPIQVSKPTTPGSYSQTSFSSSSYGGTYKPNTIQSTFKAKDAKNTYKPQSYEANTLQNTYRPTELNVNYNPEMYKSNYQIGNYQSQYQGQLDDALNRVTNWNYDPMQDANYRALAKVYSAQGNLAAKNSLADAAALNGGYGTSHAVSAAQQARNQYNQQLAAMIPELEQTAYTRAQGTLSALRDADNTAYGRFQDAEDAKRWLESHNFDVSKYNNQELLNMANLEMDKANFREGQAQFGANLDFNIGNANEQNRLNAAQFVDNMNQFSATHGLNVHNSNQDNQYRAAELKMDADKTNEANRYNAANFKRDTWQMNRDDYWKAQGMNQAENQFAYDALLDRYGLLNNNYWQGLDYNYQLGRDKVADQQWGMNYNYQLGRDKVADQQWALEYALAKKGSSGGGGGGSSRKSSGGSSGGGYVAAAETIPITKEDLENLKKPKTKNAGSSGHGSAGKTNVMLKM